MEKQNLPSCSLNLEYNVTWRLKENLVFKIKRTQYFLSLFCMRLLILRRTTHKRTAPITFILNVSIWTKLCIIFWLNYNRLTRVTRSYLNGCTRVLWWANARPREPSFMRFVSHCILNKTLTYFYFWKTV